jgi:hypothetical protein
MASNEFFYRDKDGKKQDVALHEEILAGDHPVAENIGEEQARKAGLTEAEITKLYGND